MSLAIRANNTSPSSIVRTTASQADGKILIGGGFTTIKGVSAPRMVRLNNLGEIDTTFLTNLGTGPGTGAVYKIVLQADGKILVGGIFSTWNGASAISLVRLNSDGTRDTTFTSNMGTGFAYSFSGQPRIEDIAIHSTGKIIAVGRFNSLNGITANFIVCLNSDGTMDTAFQDNLLGGVDGPNPNTIIYDVEINSTGIIFVGGNFQTFADINGGYSYTYAAALTIDGFNDSSTYWQIGPDAEVRSIAIQSDGKILFGGYFTYWYGYGPDGFAYSIVRINTDGSFDETFSINVGTGTGAYGAPDSILVLPSDEIIVGGSFSNWNGVLVRYLVKLNNDGTINSTFNANKGNAANTDISSVSLHTNNTILVGGAFDRWPLTDLSNKYIVNLNTDGTLNKSILGYWRNTKMPYAKVASVWKPIKAGYTKVAGVWRDWWLQGGINDTAFTTNTGTAAIAAVNSIAVQSDGKILLGGAFITWNGTTVNRIVRLNSDGTRDTVFTTNTGTAASLTVNSIAVQSDGKILVGGAFTTWNGITGNRIVRLNSDGTRDIVFTTNNGTGATGAGATVNSIAVQSDGKILVGGTFSAWNGTTVGRIVRLNSDGTRDTAFTTNTGTAAIAAVNSIAVQSDGKILLGGAFITWNGTTVNRIVRLNSDGTRDTTFTTNTGTAASGTVTTIALQPGGKILLGGYFATWNGTTVNYIVRLNSDGTRDTTFTTNTGTAASLTVNSIAVQSDGKILVGGAFTTWNGTTVNCIVRLNSDGTRDTVFTTNTGTAASLTVNSIAVQSDGKILVGGAFTTWNGTTVNCIVRIGGALAQ